MPQARLDAPHLKRRDFLFFFFSLLCVQVRALRQKFPTLDIEVDGGLGPDTIDEAAKAGANMIVSGSAIFKADDPKAVIETMRRSVERFGNGMA